MSDEQRKDEEPEVEGHVRQSYRGANDEPGDEAEVEGHVRQSFRGANDEPGDEAEGESDVEAHVRQNVRPNYRA